MQVDSSRPISVPYASNPLIKPLIKFHGKIASSFDCLPSQGKTLEIAKRVVIIVISPFAYLTLGLLALAGIAANSVFKNRAVKNLSNKPQNQNSIQNQKPLLSVAAECDKIKQQFITTVNQAKEINQIQSAKIFLDIECDHKKFSKDHIIKRQDSSLFDQVFLSGIADEILTEAKNSLKIQNADQRQLCFRWIAVLKDKDGVFHEANASRMYFNDEVEYSEGTDKLDSNNLRAYFNIVLDGMMREIKPQLDNQFNFV
jgi:hypothetical protein